MHRPPAASRWLPAVLLVLALLGGCGADRHDGQVYRRGWLTGEQIRLRDDRSYVWERWRRFGAEETLESGTWVQLGEVISLVPAGGARQARVMRMLARDGERLLYEPTAGGARPATDAMFERLDP
jgi:hypothetical protein